MPNQSLQRTIDPSPTLAAAKAGAANAVEPKRYGS